MKEKLINLIRKNNVIIIRGPVGSGKSLLLTKLANHPEFKGHIYGEDFSPDNLPSQSNVFIDEVIFYMDNFNYQEKLRCWSIFLASARHHQQKIFLAVSSIEELWLKEARILADLIINTQEISKDRQHVSIQIEYGGKRWKSKILLTGDDFASARLANSNPPIFGKFERKNVF